MLGEHNCIGSKGAHVHSTFLRHQQQCSGPLKMVDVFHGKGALRLVRVRVRHGTEAGRPTSSSAGCGIMGTAANARLRENGPVHGWANGGAGCKLQTATHWVSLAYWVRRLPCEGHHAFLSPELQ
jgi:hypothetical protein